MLLTLIFTLGGATVSFGFLWASHQPMFQARKPPQLGTVPTRNLSDLDDDDWGGDRKSSPDDTGINRDGPDGPDPSVGDDPERIVAEVRDLNLVLTNFVTQLEGSIWEFDEIALRSDEMRSSLLVGSRGAGELKKLGDGPGKLGGVKAAERWEIVFESGMTEDEYSRQLDFFKIELGVIVGGKLHKVSRLAARVPAVVYDASVGPERYFRWRDEARRLTDLRLLKKVHDLPLADDTIVLHFYPLETQIRLIQLERQYAADHGRNDLKLVAKTKFVVRRTENGYDFDVAKQTYLSE